MGNTPIPRTAVEMAVRPCNTIKEYTLSEAELEEIRLKYPKQETMKRPKAPIQIKMGGAKQMAKEGPDSGVTKHMLLEGLAAGKTVRDVETEHGMKQNTMAYWVKKWGLEGISREQAKAMLTNKTDGSVPPASSGKSEGSEVQKLEKQPGELLGERACNLIKERDQLAAENKKLKSELDEVNSLYDRSVLRGRDANVKIGEYLQAIQELQERVRELEAAEPPALPPIMEMVPKKATELQRIDGIIEDLSRARWILERVEG